MDWIAFSIASLCTLHPFVTFPLSLLPRAAVPLRLTGPRPATVALLFCCHNEARTIDAKIANLRTLLARYPELTVFIHLDACSDDTEARLNGVSPRVHVTAGTQRQGKNHGLNGLLQKATAEIVAFTDANVLIDDDALGLALDYFRDPGIGCVAGHLRYINEHASSTAHTGGLYWRFEEALKRLESTRGSTVAVDGSLFLARRALVAHLPADVPNDFFTSIDILARGWRVVSAPDVRCTEKSATALSDELRRKVRITTRAMTTHLLLSARLRQLSPFLQYVYFSHKLLRWFAFYWLVFAALAGILCLATVVGWPVASLVAMLFALLFGAGAVWRTGPLAQVFDILAAFAATAYGATRALFGQRVAVWSIPETAR